MRKFPRRSGDGRSQASSAWPVRPVQCVEVNWPAPRVTGRDSSLMTVTSVRRARPRRNVPPPSATTPAADQQSRVWPARWLSLETFAYAAILLAAVITRFWDLGRRALHHDESLHAQFSWLLA